jgi:hypothetical protein
MEAPLGQPTASNASVRAQSGGLSLGTATVSVRAVNQALQTPVRKLTEAPPGSSAASRLALASAPRPVPTAGPRCAQQEELPQERGARTKPPAWGIGRGLRSSGARSQPLAFERPDPLRHAVNGGSRNLASVEALIP